MGDVQRSHVPAHSMLANALVSYAPAKLRLWFSERDKTHDEERLEKLPDVQALNEMPRETRREIERIAAGKMHRLFAPVLQLWRAKFRRKHALRTASAIHISLVEACRKSSLIERWPEPYVEQMSAQALSYKATDGEILLHEGEPAASGVWILVRGQAKVVHKSGGKAVKHPDNRVLAEIDPPYVLGDFTQLTEQPRTASIVAVGETDWFTIPKRVFMASLEQLPQSIQRHVYQTAFAERRAVMWSMFPMRPEDFRRSFLFQTFTDGQLSQLQGRLKPCCYRLGQDLCTFGESGNEMFFLRRGEVEVLVPERHTHSEVLEEEDAASPLCSPTPPADKASSENSSEAEKKVADSPVFRGWGQGAPGPMKRVAVLGTGATLGEMSLVFGEKRSATVRAITHCDVWSLLFADLELCFGQGDIRMKVRDSANAQRWKWLRDGQKAAIAAVDEAIEQCTTKGDVPEIILRERLYELESDLLLQSILNCPILSDTCSAQCLVDIRKALDPRVYSPGDALTSRSESCDRLLVMVRGKALVQNPHSVAKQYLHVGEMVGFSCLADHRWLHAVTAWVTCDCWELPRDKLLAILKRHECLAKSQHSLRRLLSQRTLPDAVQLTPMLFPRYDDPREVRMVGVQEERPAPPPRVTAQPIVVPAEMVADDSSLSPAQRERRATLRDNFSKGLATRAEGDSPRATGSGRNSPRKTSQSSPLGRHGSLSHLADALEARVDAVTRKVSERGAKLLAKDKLQSPNGAKIPSPLNRSPIAPPAAPPSVKSA
eukprot:Hpha_TRINITY_DN4905_c0_g1::TRINITY_DN4905_c0_g1_i1::g.51371::m.51371